MSPLKQSNNIAARMGRWSASHWKTAVFGWLAFVVLAVAAGGGRDEADRPAATPTSARPTRPTRFSSRPASRPTRRPRSCSSRASSSTIADAAFRATVAGCDRDGGAVRGRSPRTCARRSTTRPGLGRRAHRHGRVRHARQADGRREADRPDHHRDRQDRRPPPRLLRRRGGLDQLRQGAERRVQPAARAGRRAVGAADPDRAALRLRGARRRRAAAAARAVGRHRDARPDRAPEPPRPDGSERQRGRAARRARRRRRLLALLPEARARGAGGRARARGPRSRPPPPRPAGRCSSPA